MSGAAPATRRVTAELADWALAASFETLSPNIRTEAARAFLNWVGCALGGSGEAVVAAAERAALMTGGTGTATVLGRGRRTDVVSAAFLNCLSSSALAYDDTHLATVTHPTGPVAAPLLAEAESRAVSGRDLLTALAVGIEIQCRLSNALLLPPAQANVALYITGITGPVGGAVAMGRILGFDARRMRWAIGHAATQGAGFRATHGAMSGLAVPALGARAGMFAAHLAAAGVDCREDVIEAPKGFLEIFAPGADPAHAVDDLGSRWEMSANTYKPYPCGIVVQPAIDACLDVAAQMRPSDRVESATLTVHPLTMVLADRPHPRDIFEAQVSLQHWAACVLLRGAAGIAEVRQEVIGDPGIAALRGRIAGRADDSLARDQARAEVRLTDGRSLTASVVHARGSIARPMTDDELDAKFLAQATTVLDAGAAGSLLAVLRGLAEEGDAGAAVMGAMGEGGAP